MYADVLFVLIEVAKYSIILLLTVKLVQLLTISRCKCYNLLSGKTALITGGSEGIGYQTALSLASRGCRVIIGGIGDCKKLKLGIIDETNNPNIAVKHLDLSSLDSVRSFAKEVIADEDRLDYLIINAGVGSGGNKHTSDGLDPTMQINYLGHFLLTHLLIGLLKKSAPSRIITISSVAAQLHWFTWGSFEVLENFRLWLPNVSRIYIHTKLCQIAAANEFARRLKGTGVTSNSLHTGLVKTAIFSNTRRLMDLPSQVLMMMFEIVILFFGKNLEDGIQTVLHLVACKDLEKVTGEHFWECRIFRSPAKARKEEFIKKMWEDSEKLVHLKEEEKLPTVTLKLPQT